MAELTYCTRCGRKLDENKYCERCGLTFNQTQWHDDKPCKKCRKKIPVNANFCCYCGQDQAFIVLSEQPKPNTANQDNLSQEWAKQHTPANGAASRQHWQQFGQNNPSQNDAEMQSLVEMLASVQKAVADQPKSLRKNESAKPGLVTSTKLFLKDTFVYRKKMGRADFWWGYLGVVLLYIFFIFIVAVGLLKLTSEAFLLKNQVPIVLISAIPFYVTTFSATWRRMHDTGLPGGLAFLMFLSGVGQIIVYVLASLPHNPNVVGYYFDEAQKEEMMAQLKSQNQKSQSPQADEVNSSLATSEPRQSQAAKVMQTSQQSMRTDDDSRQASQDVSSQNLAQTSQTKTSSEASQHSMASQDATVSRDSTDDNNDDK